MALRNRRACIEPMSDGPPQSPMLKFGAVQKKSTCLYTSIEREEGKIKKLSKHFDLYRRRIVYRRNRLTENSDSDRTARRVLTDVCERFVGGSVHVLGNGDGRASGGCCYQKTKRDFIGNSIF